MMYYFWLGGRLGTNERFKAIVVSEHYEANLLTPLLEAVCLSHGLHSFRSTGPCMLCSLLSTISPSGNHIKAKVWFIEVKPKQTEYRQLTIQNCVATPPCQKISGYCITPPRYTSKLAPGQPKLSNWVRQALTVACSIIGKTIFASFQHPGNGALQYLWHDNMQVYNIRQSLLRTQIFCQIFSLLTHHLSKSYWSSPHQC